MVKNTDTLTRISGEIARIAAERLDASVSEATTRQVAIDPLLEALGWRMRDRSQVSLEHTVGKSQLRLDYCLKLGGREAVYIEAKSVGTDLTEPKHSEQLATYAFRGDNPLAVLTNGLEWLLYVPSAHGRWEERLFAEADLTNDPESAARTLTRFLAHENIESGDAWTDAEAERKRLGRERSARNGIDRAWEELLNSDELARSLKERTQALTGYEPRESDVREFLTERSEFFRQVRSSAASMQERGTAKKKDGVRPLTRPTSVTIGGQKYEVRSWRAVLPIVCEHLMKHHPREFERQAQNGLNQRGWKISRDGRSRREHKNADIWTPGAIGNSGWFVETNLSGDDTKGAARALVRDIAGDELRIEFEQN